MSARAPLGQRGHLNLARRPFVNSRPVVRAAAILWVLGALLLLGNVTLFWSYLSGSSEKRAELARKEQEIARQQRDIQALEARLAGLDLEQQNEQVAYLNRKIEERTFSWSGLFDHLAEVLPDDVRLVQLQPSAIGGDERQMRSSRGRRPGGAAGGRAPVAASDRVPLVLQGEARTDEALLQFIDNLFGHPAFERPDLSREVRDEERRFLRFDIQVAYLPAAGERERAAEPPVILEGEEGAEGGEAGEGAAGAAPREPESGEAEIE